MESKSYLERLGDAGKLLWVLGTPRCHRSPRRADIVCTISEQSATRGQPDYAIRKTKTRFSVSITALGGQLLQNFTVAVR